MDLLHCAVGAYVIYHDVLFCEANKAPAESPTGICQPTFPHHQQHPNKRRKIVDRIFPFHSAAEITAFDAIPSQLKIDLVDSIIKTAVPGLDDLLAAASSVVSLCLDAEAESWERNKAILELKDVLETFGVALQGSGQEESKTDIDVGQESNEEYAVFNKEQNGSIFNQPVEVRDRESGLDNAGEQHNANVEPQKTPAPPDLQQPDTFQNEKQYVSRGTQYIQPFNDGPQTPEHYRNRYPPHSPSGSSNQPVRRPTPQGPVQQPGYGKYGNNNTMICCRCSQCTTESHQMDEEISHQHESGYTLLPGQKRGGVSGSGGGRNYDVTGSVPGFLDGFHPNEDISVLHAHIHREPNHQLPQNRYQQQYGRPQQYPPCRSEKSPPVHNKIQTYQKSDHQNSLNGLDQIHQTRENQPEASSYHAGTQRFEREAASSNSFCATSTPRTGSSSNTFPNINGTRHVNQTQQLPQAQLTNTNANNHTNPSQHATNRNTTTHPSLKAQHQDKQRQPNLGTSLLGKRKTLPQTQNQPHNRTQNHIQTHTGNQNHKQTPNSTRTNKDRNNDSGKTNPGNKTKAPVAPMLHVRRLGMFESMR